MANRNNYLRIIALAVVALVVSVIWYSNARANALDIITTNTTATTTLAYMTAGTATTTYYYDAYGGGVSDPNASDKAVLIVQFTASSTSSKLNWSYEYSQGVTGVDCTVTPNACDWYSDDIQYPVNSTSTQRFDYSTANSALWNFASSSQGGAVVTALNSRGLKTLWVPTPARYARVFFSVPVGAAAGAVWASFLEQKQQP